MKIMSARYEGNDWFPKQLWIVGIFEKKKARYQKLTHWGWVTHMCINKLTIIGSDNGLSPHRRQAIIWANDVLLIRPLGRK